MATPTRARAKPSKQSLYLLAALGAAVLVAILYLRHRNSSVPQTETQAPSVGPGADNSTPLPSGGASSIPGQLPPGAISEPDMGTSGAVANMGTSGPDGSEAPTTLAAYYPELSPLGPTISHSYGDTAVYGQGGPVIDVDQLTSPSIIPSSTSTPAIPHPVGGGPQA